MTTYALSDGDTLVVSIDGGAWETITFVVGDFADISAATADELADVLNRTAGLQARADDAGMLVLVSPTRGATASLEVDTSRSTAAAVLGLAGAQAAAFGTGLQAPRLVSRATEPFPLPSNAECFVVVDGRRRRVAFDKGTTSGASTAEEVVGAINRTRKVARVGRDGHVLLMSDRIGPDASLEVQPGRVDEGHTDAAAILGFVGADALSKPHSAEPAVLVGGQRSTGLLVTNLTAAPIELHLLEGPLVLPARGSAPIAPGDAGHLALQRLIEQGVVRLTAAEPGRT
jgi:hypothetical protein